MAGLLRKIGEFDSATEDWTSYLERLTHYLATNGIAEEKKKDTFLCCVGIRETFGLLRALVAPQNPGDKTFKELTDALTIHLAPKPLVIAERFYFHKRVSPLKCTPLACRSFRNIAMSVLACLIPYETDWCGPSLSDTLRDRRVCDMKDEKVQRRLLRISDLTFKKALEEAEIAERAAKDAAQFHEAEAEVHKLQRKPEQHCYCCEGFHSPRHVDMSTKGTGTVGKGGTSHRHVGPGRRRMATPREGAKERRHLKHRL